MNSCDCIRPGHIKTRSTAELSGRSHGAELQQVPTKSGIEDAGAQGQIHSDESYVSFADEFFIEGEQQCS